MAFYKMVDLIIKMDPKYETLKNQSIPYLVNQNVKEEFILEVSDSELLIASKNCPNLDLNTLEYMIYGSKFYNELLLHNAFLLHASCVVYQNKAYLFSAPSGTGKSTHTLLWKKVFNGSYILNDDKPALLIKNNKIWACGTPFSGKTDLNVNRIVEVKGIAFIKRSKTNEIKLMNKNVALYNLLNQTIRPKEEYKMNLLLDHIKEVISKINCYELFCNMEDEAANISFEGMNNE